MIAGIDDRFDWRRLRAKDPAALDVAAAEAHELARIVAAQTVVVEREAVVAEFDERHRTLSSAMWSPDVLDGYGLHSSLGAYTLARIAVGWVPSGHTGHRHEALRPRMVLQALVDQGVDETTAASVVGEWEGVEPGFRPDAKGLAISVIAGLAERSLMRHERNAALAQVAYSPRCLHRLAATCNLMASVRALLPWIPSPRLGPELVTAFGALALGRPDRVRELFGDAPAPLALRTLAELAGALMDLEAGVKPSFGEDMGEVMLPDRWAEDDAPVAADVDRGDAEGDAEALGGGGERENLGFAHDGTDSESEGSEVFGDTQSFDDSPSLRPHGWEEDVTPVDEQTLAAWTSALLSVSSLVSRRRALLGFKLPPRPDSVPPTPIAPDPRRLRIVLERIGGRDRLEGAMGESVDRLHSSPLETLFPAIRGVLRMIAASAEGIAVSEPTIKQSGNFGWLLSRARALSKVVQGDLDAALDAVARLSPELAPEGRWARSRQDRFGRGPVEPAATSESRPVAAILLSDLIQQLARTLAGTL